LEKRCPRDLALFKKEEQETKPVVNCETGRLTDQRHTRVFDATRMNRKKKGNDSRLTGSKPKDLKPKKTGHYQGAGR